MLIVTGRPDDGNGFLRRERTARLVLSKRNGSEAIVSRKYDVTSTTDKDHEGKDLREMRVLVTGESAGLGVPARKYTLSAQAKSVSEFASILSEASGREIRSELKWPEELKVMFTPGD